MLYTNNLEVIMFNKANMLIDKKLIAMKELVLKEVAAAWDMIENVTKSFGVNSQHSNQTKDQGSKGEYVKSDIKFAREVHSKIAKIVGHKYMQIQEDRSGGFIEDLQKYWDNRILTLKQRYEDDFQFNMLKFEKFSIQPGTIEAKIASQKDEIRTQKDIIYHLEAENSSYKHL